VRVYRDFFHTGGQKEKKKRGTAGVKEHRELETGSGGKKGDVHRASIFNSVCKFVWEKGGKGGSWMKKWKGGHVEEFVGKT